MRRGRSCEICARELGLCSVLTIQQFEMQNFISHATAGAGASPMTAAVLATSRHLAPSDGPATATAAPLVHASMPRQAPHSPSARILTSPQTRQFGPTRRRPCAGWARRMHARSTHPAPSGRVQAVVLLLHPLCRATQSCTAAPACSLEAPPGVSVGGGAASR